MGEENFLSVMTMSNYCGMTSKSTSIASTTKPKLFFQTFSKCFFSQMKNICQIDSNNLSKKTPISFF
jgi:hypothetical protein